MAMLCSLVDSNRTANVFFYFFSFFARLFFFSITSTGTTMCIVYIDLFGLIFQFSLVLCAWYYSSFFYIMHITVISLRK